MINTRILEQRLGWRSAGPGSGVAPKDPESRPIRHEALLQGKIRSTAARQQRGVRRTDVEAAWAAIPMLAASVDEMASARRALVSLDRTSAAAAGLDQFRAQLLRLAKENGWRRIGITSPTRGCGRTFISAGLAASVARLEYMRVLLLDLDLAAPSLARQIGIPAPMPLAAFLKVSASPENQLVRIGQNLALGLNETASPDAAELLQDPDLILGLRNLVDSLAPDVVIHDLPPLLDDPAAVAFLPQLDAVLLVADGTRTVARDIAECERILEGQLPLLGVILNKSEDADIRRRGGARG